jgi:hypothetical protein
MPGAVYVLAEKLKIVKNGDGTATNGHLAGQDKQQDNPR